MKSSTSCLTAIYLLVSSLAVSAGGIDEAFADPGFDLNNAEQRARAVQRIRAIENQGLARAQDKANGLGIPMRTVLPDGTINEIVGLDENGNFVINTTNNAAAAISTAADLAQAAPLNLSGNGVTVAVWDGGGVRTTHQEFTGGRARSMDGASVTDHATHVAGTIAAAGINAAAKGMAPSVRVDSYDWGSDTSEMTNRAATGPGQAGQIYISNHSYGIIVGWNGNQWTGVGTDQNAYAPQFGQYNTGARDWDLISYNAPYYLIFKSAGNDNLGNPEIGSSVSIGGATVTYNPAIHPAGDGLYRNTTTDIANGYENMSSTAIAKNIMTVGAARDAVTNGLRDPSVGTLTPFSSRGPTDDGRIKPDIVANGSALDSSIGTSDTAYGGKNGTSMASPNAAGSASLLVQHFANLSGGGSMRASTLKGLLIHTATDLGNSGPDYHYGWGLMDTKQAADLITDHYGNPSKGRINESLLNTTTQLSKTYIFSWDGTSPLRATLCWTDPAGVSTSTHDLRSARLVNNLDLKLVAPNGAQYYPYTMPFVGTWTVASMSLPATNGVNNTDNVEQVHLANPGQTGNWQAIVTYQGSLTNSQQHFSLLLSGSQSPVVGVDINSISPSTAETGSLVTADITGSGLSADTVVRLTRTGSADIVGTSPQLISANKLRVQFKLTGAASGLWNLVATSPNASTDTLPGAFAVTYTQGTLSITPATGLSSTGSFGVIPPTSANYTLSNIGSTVITWTAAKSANWVTLSATGGTLAAGASATISVSINSAANLLGLGSYSDTVTFSNITNGLGSSTRSVSLTVNPIPATVTLSGLTATYDGTPKRVSVTTIPASIATTVSYNGSATAPTNAGTYSVVATVTEPNHTGGASGSLVIAKASQTISFGALSAVPDNSPPFALTAIASSGLSVAYASSNSSVATVSGNTVTIIGIGTTTLTASQAGNGNYLAAASVPQTLTVVRSNPLAHAGGPYSVGTGQSLPLVASASLPSHSATITAYDWDLNNDGTFGDVTGVTPATIDQPTLTSTWGMAVGSNVIGLRVTDSAGKSSIGFATVEIIAGLPLPWLSTDIGTGMLAGNATFSGGTFTQSGSGLVGGSADKLRFSYQTLSGDGEIIARISSLQNTGAASTVGVMIRNSLEANSMQIFMGMSGANTYRWIRRTSNGGSSSSTDSSTGTVPNTWVRVVRKGGTITAYKSTNGTTWTSVGSTSRTKFAANCYIGIAVASGSNTTLNTSQFANVVVIP